MLLALKNFDHPKILEALHKVAASDPDRLVRGRALEIAEEVAAVAKAVVAAPRQEFGSLFAKLRRG